MIDDLANDIRMCLGSQFEQDLFDAALYNLKDHNNKLRFGNFAYSMRELVRHFLDRLAPDSWVLDAPWFVVENKNNPKRATRRQKMRYAIQGWLSDDYVSEHIFIDTNDVCSRLLDSVDELSKYTHINEDTLYPKGDIVDDTSIAVLEDIQHLFHSIRDAQDRIMTLVCDSIDETMVEAFYMSVIDDIDMLASHYEIEHFTIQELRSESVDDFEIKMIANGIVHVRLQYGSNGDMRRGDGWIQYIDLPFSSRFNASYKNKEGDVHIVDYNIEVDNAPYYDVDKAIDEYIDGKKPSTECE